MSRSNERPHPAADHDAFEVQSALLGSAGTPLKPSRRRLPGWLGTTPRDTRRNRLWALLAGLLSAMAALVLVLALVCLVPSLGAFFLP